MFLKRCQCNTVRVTGFLKFNLMSYYPKLSCCICLFLMTNTTMTISPPSVCLLCQIVTNGFLIMQPIISGVRSCFVSSQLCYSISGWWSKPCSVSCWTRGCCFVTSYFFELLHSFLPDLPVVFLVLTGFFRSTTGFMLWLNWTHVDSI